jgi:N-methylhydantoinase A
VPLGLASVAAAIERLRAERVESVAICLLHSYANPAHERAVADAIRVALPDVAISVSSEILPEIKEYPRTSTTAINAYVQPIVRSYIAALDARLRALGIDAPLRLMQSNGGLASAEFAAGIITFDMGGTTAKAGLVENGEVIRTEAIEIGGGVMAGSRLLVGAGYMLKLPAIDLAEVGAGG